MLKLGLALGSGGARGLAHIGVIRALEENHIPIDYIAGTSSGALIGGLYLALGSISEVEKIATSLNYKDLLSIFSDVSVTTGFIRGDKMTSYLDQLLSGRTIESLPRPFTAIATDIASGDVVTITKGNLAHAIRASSSIPGLLNTIIKDERHLIDGGVSCPVPVRQVKQMGSKFVIAVNLDVYDFLSSQKLPRLTDVGVAAVNLLRFNLSRELCQDADLAITPDVASVSSLNPVSFIHGEAIIQAGYTATIPHIPHIRKSLQKPGFFYKLFH